MTVCWWLCLKFSRWKLTRIVFWICQLKAISLQLFCATVFVVICNCTETTKLEGGTLLPVWRACVCVRETSKRQHAVCLLCSGYRGAGGAHLSAGASWTGYQVWCFCVHMQMLLLIILTFSEVCETVTVFFFFHVIGIFKIWVSLCQGQRKNVYSFVWCI